VSLWCINHYSTRLDGEKSDVHGLTRVQVDHSLQVVDYDVVLGCNMQAILHCLLFYNLSQESLLAEVFVGIRGLSFLQVSHITENTSDFDFTFTIDTPLLSNSKPSSDTEATSTCLT